MKRLLALVSAALVTHAANAQQPMFVTEDYAPFQIVEGVKPLSGFATELVAEMQSRAGTNGPVTVLPWARAYKQAQSKPNTVIFTIAQNEERMKQFAWVGNFYSVRQAYFALASRDDVMLESELDAIDYKLALPRGPGFIEKMTAIGFADDKIVLVADQNQGIRMLHKGRVDLSRNNVLGFFTEVDKLSLPRADFKVAHVFNEIPMGIAAHKGTAPALLTKLRTALDDIKADGTLEAITQKWLPE